MTSLTLSHCRTPLFNAASNGKLDAVKHLLKSGANKAALSSKGRTALHMCVRSEHSPRVAPAHLLPCWRWCFAAGVPWVDDGSVAPPPRDRAASTGHTDTVQVLVGAKANVNAIDDGACSSCPRYPRRPFPAARTQRTAVLPLTSILFATALYRVVCAAQLAGRRSSVRACTATTPASAR